MMMSGFSILAFDNEFFVCRIIIKNIIKMQVAAFLRARLLETFRNADWKSFWYSPLILIRKTNSMSRYASIAKKFDLTTTLTMKFGNLSKFQLMIQFARFPLCLCFFFQLIEFHNFFSLFQHLQLKLFISLWNLCTHSEWKMLMRWKGELERERNAQLIRHKFMQIAASDFNDLSTFFFILYIFYYFLLFCSEIRVEFLLLIAFTNLKSIVIFILSLFYFFPLGTSFFMSNIFFILSTAGCYASRWQHTMDRCDGGSAEWLTEDKSQAVSK